MEGDRRGSTLNGMLIRLIHVLTILLLVASAGSAPNAADDYRELLRQWDAVPEEQLLLLQSAPSQFELSPQAVAAMRTLDELSGIVIRAARKDHCDFGLDYTKGPELLIPHLATMRAAARNMETLARWQRLRGNDDAAVRIADAMYGVAFHLGNDKLLISSLVGQANFENADDITDELIEAGSIDPAAATLLLRRLKRADQQDPFRMTDAMEMEKDLMSNWVQLQMQAAMQPDGSHVMSEETREFFDIIKSSESEEVDWIALFHADNMAPFEDYMDRVAEVFRMEDEAAATAKVQELERQLVEGQFGDFAKLLAVAPQGALKRKFAGQRALAERIAMLEDIANGTVDPLEHANAAWWYIRAADAVANSTEAQRATPEFWQPISDDLMIATIIDRCEFPFATWDDSIDSSYPLSTVPPWSAGLRLCLDQLIGNAELLLAQGDTAGAVNLLSTALELAADLASNITLVDSIIAQDATEQIAQLVQPMLDAGALDATQRQQLLQAARSIPARDPFGYMQSADTTRRLLLEHLGDALSEDVLRGFPSDPDGVLFATAWCELIHQMDEPYGFVWPVETDWAVFDGVLDRDTILNARIRGTESLEAASVGVDVELQPVELIATPSIEERRQRGVELLRTWKRSLGQ